MRKIEFRDYLSSIREERKVVRRELVSIYEQSKVNNLLQRFLFPEILLNGDNIQEILSVGCGEASEAKALIRMFRTAKFTGVDISRLTIKIARRTGYMGASTRYRARDARRSDALEKESYDLLIMRNPQVTSFGQNWEAIFQNGIAALKPGGIMMVSAASDYEANLARAHMKCNGIDVKLDALTFLTDFVAFDSNVLIGRKPAKV